MKWRLINSPASIVPSVLSGTPGFALNVVAEARLGIIAPPACGRLKRVLLFVQAVGGRSMSPARLVDKKPSLMSGAKPAARG